MTSLTSTPKTRDSILDERMHNQGYFAFCRGAPQSSCPHEQGFANAEAWNTGWIAAQTYAAHAEIEARTRRETQEANAAEAKARREEKQKRNKANRLARGEASRNLMLKRERGGK